MRQCLERSDDVRVFDLYVGQITDTILAVHRDLVLTTLLLLSTCILKYHQQQVIPLKKKCTLFILFYRGNIYIRLH